MSNGITRESGIELLRILATGGIIILHINNPLPSYGGGLKFVAENSLNEYILYFLENLMCCAVNLFVLISGYFMCNTNKRTFSKTFGLLMQVSVFRILSYVLMLYRGDATFAVKGLLGCCLPVNYFAVLYCVLYIISPYINIVLNNLDKIALKKLLLTVITVFSVWTTFVDALEILSGCQLQGLSTVGAYGAQAGYTIVNFVVLYVVGAYLSRINVEKRLNVCWLLSGVICCVMVSSILSVVLHKHNLPIFVCNYNNPLVIAMAGGIFLIFKKFHFYSKVINELAKATFTCFLVHFEFLRFVDVEKAVSSSWYLMIMKLLVACILIFLVAYVIYKVYDFTVGKLVNCVEPLLDKVKIGLKEEQ